MQYKLRHIVQLNVEAGTYRKGNISNYEFAQIKFDPADMYLIESKLKEFIQNEFRPECKLEAENYIDKYFDRFTKLIKQQRPQRFPGKRILSYGFVCVIECEDYPWSTYYIKIHTATSTLLIY